MKELLKKNKTLLVGEPTRAEMIKLIHISNCYELWYINSNTEQQLSQYSDRKIKELFDETKESS